MSEQSEQSQEPEQPEQPGKVSAKTPTLIRRLPHFFDPHDTDSLFGRFMDAFGQVLEQAEVDLLRVMHAHWVNTADNAGAQGFDARQRGDLDQIFALYLESLGGTSQLRQLNRRSGAAGLADDALYRRRITGLINVLRQGAATREGIITIVAANLGIVGDTPEAAAARRKIIIEEFSPRPQQLVQHEMGLFESVVIPPSNTRVTPEIRLTLDNSVGVTLTHVRVVDEHTDQAITYRGNITPGAVLVFFPAGSATLNGQTIPPHLIAGRPPELLSDTTNDYTVLVGEDAEQRPASRFDHDAGRFDQAGFTPRQLPLAGSRWRVEAMVSDTAGQAHPVGRFDHTDSPFDNAGFMLTPRLTLRVIAVQLTPGTFVVRVPWHIENYTEQFDATRDDPRRQIGYIVNRVKAAGVHAAIRYELRLEDTHDLDARFKLVGEQHTQEAQQLEQANFDIRSQVNSYPGGVEHGMEAQLRIPGVFDYTRLDAVVFG